jgi:3-oxoacyl-[acyl-carrier-protein] synthase II
VVGWGVKAPGGCKAEELWSSLRTGRSTAEPYADPRWPGGGDLLVCRADGFDPAAYLAPSERRRWDRAHQLAIGAAADAMACVGGELPPADRCAVVCGTGLGGATTYELQHEHLLERGARAVHPLTIPLVMPSAAAALLGLRFGFQGPALTVNTACASGATAIGEALELLRRGAADLVLAGGVDALLTYGTLACFDRLEVMSHRVDVPELAARPFDVERDGFVLGEGAGFVVLRREADAAAYGDRVLGHLDGYGTNADAYHLVAPSPSGEGALRCMRLALADADVAPSEVSQVNAHGTGTVANDLAESAALVSLFPGGTPPVTATKGTTGHLVGASGAVEAVATLLSLRERAVPPVAGLRTVDPVVEADVVHGGLRCVPDGYALSCSFGFGGANTCLVLSAA